MTRARMGATAELAKLLTVTTALFMVSALAWIALGSLSAIPWGAFLCSSLVGALLAGASVFGHLSGSVLKPAIAFGLPAGAVTLAYFLVLRLEFNQNPERFFGVFGGGIVWGGLLVLVVLYASRLRRQS